MFDKLKQIQKAREIQKSLKDKEVVVEQDGIKIIIDGTLKIKKIEMNSDLNKEKQEAILTDLFNEAIQKIQMMLAKEMSQMGGMF